MANTRSACMCAKSLRSYLTLCNPMDCSPPGSSVHGIFQGRILEWVAMLSSRGSSRPRDQTFVSNVSCIGRRFFFFLFFFLPLVPTGKPKHLQDLHQVTHLLGDTGNDNDSIKAPRPPHRAWFWGGGCCRETGAPATGPITEKGCRVSTSQTRCPVPSVPHRLCLRPSLDLSFSSNHVL